MPLSRRAFLKGSVAAGAAALVPWRGAMAAGANEEIRVAIIGTGSQGSGHLKTYVSDAFKAMNVRLVAVADADQKNADRAAATAGKAGVKVDAYQDLRKVLDRKDIDAVVTATPNHWHSLVGIWACQAGKDVYIEKPMSHDIFEGRKVVEAAAKHNRIVYVGTQRRSDTGLAEAVAWLAAGNLGKAVRARSYCYRHRLSIGKTTGPQAAPATVDYDLWCGPAPKDPPRRTRFHYDWHWFWATGNGEIGNNGIHSMDAIRWVIGATCVKRAVSFGGRYAFDDDAETPNTHMAFIETDTVPIIFDGRNLTRKKGDTVQDVSPRGGVREGSIVEFEGGYFAGGWAYDNKDQRIKQFKRDEGSDHRANFIKCLRARTPESNKAPAIEGHRSALCFHLPNLSYRVGREMKPADLADQFKADKTAQDVVERFASHVGGHVDDPATWTATVGPWLTFDPKAEKVTGPFAEQANALLKGPAGGKYRAPFVVPDTV